MYPGGYNTCYITKRDYWRFDFWDEQRRRAGSSHRMAAQPGTRRSRDARPIHPGFGYGWHNVEYNHMLYTDREKLYFPLPEGWTDDYEASRYMAVPTPWVCHYFADIYLQSAADAPVHQALRDIFMAEWVQNFVLTQVYLLEIPILLQPCTGSENSRTRHGYSSRTSLSLIHI